MFREAKICQTCWIKTSCPEQLYPEKVLQNRQLVPISVDDTNVNRYSCRHFTCDQHGRPSAESARINGNFHTVETSEGRQELAFFESEFKLTAGLRGVNRVGKIYSKNQADEIFYPTGQELDDGFESFRFI